MSYRPQGFRKKLFSAEQLGSILPLAHQKLSSDFEQWQKKQIDDYEMVARYIVTLAQFRSPKDWYQGTNNRLHHLQKPLSDQHPYLKQFLSIRIKSIPEVIHQTLIYWFNGQWKLVLMEEIPSPKELLIIQRKGQRCVTMPMKLHQFQHYVLGERDVLSFILHDLIHAERFFGRPEIYHGQLGLYAFFDKHYSAFEPLLNDSLFKEEFDYAISDMNAYCVHVLKFLKSATLNYFLRKNNKDHFQRLDSLEREELVQFWSNIWSAENAPEEIKQHFHKLNDVTLTQTEELTLKQYFESRWTQ